MTFGEQLNIYLSHLGCTAQERKGFSSEPLETAAFKNITIEVCHGQWAVVAKDRAPRIRFVIHHPKLVDAIERFDAPVVES